MLGATTSRVSAIPPTSDSLNYSSSSSNGKNLQPLLSNLPLASRIFVKNLEGQPYRSKVLSVMDSDLSYVTGEASLIKQFSKFGHIVEVKLAKHEETKKSKGYAFIQYTCQDDAVLAIENMDRNIIDGRVVHAGIAKPSRSGFGAYPIGLGPPLPRNSEADVVADHLEGSHHL